MNRKRQTDSQLSLDVGNSIGDFDDMLIQPYQLYIERKDPSKNMARFYAMAISVTLFGEACLTRSWGRIGTYGQSMVHTFDREEDAVSLFLDIVKQKRLRGYQVQPAQLPPWH